MSNYRALTEKEIATLTVYGCTAGNWNKVKVVRDFTPDFISNVHFSGDIQLGTYNHVFDLPGGLKKHAGLYNCCLHNCSVGNDVFIDKIGNYIANYRIDDNVYIENTNLIVVTGKSSFGNGVQVPVINEGGGREVPIFDYLSAPLAYLLALYRHRPVMIQNLQKIIDEYAQSQASETGRIGKNSRIVNCGTIRNVKIGEYSIIEGASILENGSINGNKEAPVILKYGVKCSDFIICSGAYISDSTLISRCFVGQGSQLEKHYSAVDSLFFANCQGMHGEATAVFAGPYTVSHHKATLLIAGMFSFMNAGSGSNQSNHMYKLGPVHQGIAERGTKTGSDSYLLWPARIGAFSVVSGRHTKHPDTSDLPFSYLIGSNDESFVIPAVNLRSLGTIRDAQKWAKRDNRKDSRKLDPVNTRLLSPYTVQKMIAGVQALKHLQETSDTTIQVYSYKNSKIKRSSLQRGIDLYNLGIHKFLGNTLINRLKNTSLKSIEDVRRRLIPDSEKGLGDWIDLSGLIAPKREIEKLIEKIEANDTSLEGIQKEFEKIHQEYYEYEWTWGKEKFEEYRGKLISEITPDDIIELIERWKYSVVKLDELIYEDTKKEFNLEARIGFGVDGDEEQKQLDFELVRGKFEDNQFIKGILHHIEEKTKLANEMIEIIKNLK